MALKFGEAILYEATTGDLFTLSEFGGISIGPLDKYLSQTEVPSSIRQLGQFLHQKSDS